MPKSSEILNQIKVYEERHVEWRRNCLNLIASENVASPSVRMRLSSEFQNRYASTYAPGLPSGWLLAEQIQPQSELSEIERTEKLCVELLRELFEAKYANPRPLSGTNAISAVLLALTEPGNTIMTTDSMDGGHGPMFDDLARACGRRVEHFPFDAREYTIDPDKTIKRLKEVKPKLLVFGTSMILFPAPIGQLMDVANEIGARCVYDGSHVMGLIAGGRFQDPLREGSVSLFGSTHKTFPGPQGGIILSNASSELMTKLDNTVSPVLVDNYHLNKVAAMTIATAEMLEFGGTYATQVVRNAKALAEALHARSFDVLCEHKGFTESHQVLVNVKSEGRDGRDVAKLLSSVNIILSKTHLPDDHEGVYGGVRMGTSELTRVGMKEPEMKHIAELISRSLHNVEPRVVRAEIVDFKKQYTNIHYSVDNGKDAYNSG